MASNISIGITAKDQASSQIRGIRGLVSGLQRDAKSSILAGVGLGAGVTAFNALSGAVSSAAGFLVEATMAAAEEEAGIVRLTTALRENVEGWDGNVAAIEDVIDVRERLGFSDDEQRESLAILTAATGDISEALDIQATAMDLARLKGIDLVTASEALIRVEAGQFRMLKALGIELEEGATATEALAAVQAVAAGQAEAYGETTAGVLTALQVEFENLKEDIGKEFLPIMIELARFARDELLPAFRNFIAIIKSIDWRVVAAGIQGVIGPIVLLVQWLRQLLVATLAAISALARLAGMTPGKVFAGTSVSPKLPTYAEGTEYVPQTGMALLHQGEMVLPRSLSDSLRSFLGEGMTLGAGAPVGGQLPPIIVQLDGKELYQSTARWGRFDGPAARLPR